MILCTVALPEFSVCLRFVKRSSSGLFCLFCNVRTKRVSPEQNWCLGNPLQRSGFFKQCWAMVPKVYIFKINFCGGYTYNPRKLI